MRHRICCWLPVGLLEAVQTRLASEELADVTVPAHLQGPLPPEKEDALPPQLAPSLLAGRRRLGEENWSSRCPSGQGNVVCEKKVPVRAAHNL